MSKDVQRLALATCEFGALQAQIDMMQRDGTASLGKGYAAERCKEVLVILSQDNDLE